MESDQCGSNCKMPAVLIRLLVTIPVCLCNDWLLSCGLTASGDPALSCFFPLFSQLSYIQVLYLNRGPTFHHLMSKTKKNKKVLTFSAAVSSLH